MDLPGCPLQRVSSDAVPYIERQENRWETQVSIAKAVAADRSEGGKLIGVQAARSVAALMVAAYHATRSVSLPQYYGHVPFGNALGFGHAGVDFFFVLSGFVITHAHFKDLGRPEQLNRYLWRRFVRIYPIYWFITGLEGIRAAFAPDSAVRLAPEHVLKSLLLLPQADAPLVSVAWTLSYEMIFYLIFAFVIVGRRLCGPFILATVVLVLTGAVVAPSGTWAGVLMSPFNLLFLLGIAAARLLATRRVPCPILFIAGGIIFFLTSGVLEVQGYIPLNGLLGRLLYGSASLAILLGLVEAERSGYVHLGPAASLMGDSSYCLYLFHLSIIPITVRIFGNLGLLAILPAEISALALVGLAVLASLVLHLRVEVPMMTFLRQHPPLAFIGRGRS
jgi:exopolysaccharide production protein ExoZ